MLPSSASCLSLSSRVIASLSAITFSLLPLSHFLLLPLDLVFWALYVDWIQQGGARIAVVPFDAPTSQLNQLFSSLNGILFTGGELDLNLSEPYMKTANYFFNLALEANAKGDYFPIWGTCQGFQVLSILAAQNASVLEVNQFDSDNISLALNLTSEASHSRMFGPEMPDAIRQILTQEKVTMNLHVSGVTPETFEKNPRLKSFYRLISTNVDRKGKAFGSTIEAYNAPIYGTQWHPERPQFDWEPYLAADRSANATAAMQYAADFFVSESKKSTHTFTSATLEKEALLFYYTPLYIGDSHLVFNFPPQQQNN